MSTSANQSGISYRIVFVSPFFELEVRNGHQNWQPVRSQEPLRLGESWMHGQRATKHPLLHFVSHSDAANYARDTLGLAETRHSFWSSLFNLLGWLNPFGWMNSPSVSYDLQQQAKAEPVELPSSVVFSPVKEAA